MFENTQAPPKALLVVCDTGEYEVEPSLAELYELTRSAGAEPFGAVTQKRPAPDPATCVGSGMVEEIAGLRQKHELDLVIFDRELSPIQIRNLEDAVGTRVIDRTMLILDIFAAHARSSEGKLQVELAQLRYSMPRLAGSQAFSRQGGGIGARGPGETKLETDRRRARQRIQALEEQMQEVELRRKRALHRRQKEGFVTVALVGYTNAGKSTLMNALTGAGVLAQDKLFATLDPTARALKLPGGFTVMLVDTVGLVRRLPHQLVQAFHSTLEQAAQADILLNVCDASSPEAQEHLHVTRDLLAQLGCRGVVIPVMNQCDKLPGLAEIPLIGSGVRISAKTGQGLQALLAEIEKNLPVRVHKVRVLLPFSESALAARLRREGTVLDEAYCAQGLLVTAYVGPQMLQQLQPFLHKGRSV